MQASTRSLEIETQLHHPADCIGDTGAAAGPMLLAQAAMCLPARLGWPVREFALVSCSSDGGLRGVALVETPERSETRRRSWS